MRMVSASVVWVVFSVHAQLENAWHPHLEAFSNIVSSWFLVPSFLLSGTPRTSRRWRPSRLGRSFQGSSKLSLTACGPTKTCILTGCRWWVGTAFSRTKTQCSSKEISPPSDCRAGFSSRGTFCINSFVKHAQCLRGTQGSATSKVATSRFHERSNIHF